MRAQLRGPGTMPAPTLPVPDTSRAGTGRDMRKNGISHIAIFLFENPLVLFERPAPDMGRWSYAGVWKIWA